jgi:hypothetical protein
MTEQEFLEIWSARPESKPVFYRLYHQDDGTPLYYSMEDLPGKYIEIDLATYQQYRSNVRVVDGKLIVIPTTGIIKKLQPSKHGTPCDPRDVCIVTDCDNPHIKWSIKHRETN